MNKKVFFGLLVIVMMLVVATAGCTVNLNPSSGGTSPSPSASAVPQNNTGYVTYTNDATIRGREQLKKHRRKL